MRGHEKVKDITMTLLGLLMLDGTIGDPKQLQEWTENYDEEYVHQLMKSAADAFHIIMSDSEESLNRRYHAVVRPLYKQRFFSSVMPILLSLIVKSESSSVRSMLYRAVAHAVSATPLTAILSEASIISVSLIPILLDCLSMLSMDVLDKDIIYNVLLVLSGLLTDKNGEEALIGNAPKIINQLIDPTAYSRSMAVRETSIQWLVCYVGPSPQKNLSLENSGFAIHIKSTGRSQANNSPRSRQMSKSLGLSVMNEKVFIS